MKDDCYNCGREDVGNMLMVNNSDKFDNPDYLTELDVPFDIEFEGELADVDVVTVIVCKACHPNMVE